MRHSRNLLRASAVRQIPPQEGVPSANFFMVAGKADTQLLFPPAYVATNRPVKSH